MTVVDKACPNVVGVDIGCGMYTVKLADTEMDFEKIDEVCHYIPSGMATWEGRLERFDLTGLRCYRSLEHSVRLERSLGTLGGGNHFIEIDKASDGSFYLVIHSGSRNLGKQVAEHYQELGFGVVEKAVVIAFDQNDLPVKRAYQLRCIIVPAFPDKVAKNVYQITGRYFFIPPPDHFIVHFFDGCKRAVIETDHIFMPEMQIACKKHFSHTDSLLSLSEDLFHKQIAVFIDFSMKAAFFIPNRTLSYRRVADTQNDLKVLLIFFILIRIAVGVSVKYAIIIPRKKRFHV